ncbi:MAG: NAD(P)-dependent oxidoreductase [Saprospiraceae bacterium]|jgi:UDP-glucose 4-epimerase|nr:NAD(P)-dependent oxidoreductase [Saprospiraceae bacterium]
MKSIIIGSNGYIGRHLADVLIQESVLHMNYDIHPQALFGQSVYASLDIRDRSAFDCLPADADKIYFLAGLTGTENSFQQYKNFTDVNLGGLLHLLDWMKQTSCQARLIFPSTRLVYRGQTDTFLSEDSPKQAKTIYAMTKLAAEHALEAYGEAYGISYTIFRICVPYGHWIGQDYSYGTIGFMLSQARQKKPITIYGDGNLKRTFTHVEDVCHVLVNASSSDITHQEIYNIGGDHLQLSDVAILIANKYNVDIQNIPWPPMALRMESGDTLFNDAKLLSTGFAYYKNNIHKYMNEFI